MTDADRDEFALRITALGAAKRAALTEAVFEALWLGLEDLSLEELSRAVEAAIRQGGRWMPSAEELRQLAGQQPLDAKAIRAWNAMRAAIQRHGAWRTVDFDEPAINATVRTLGGWVRLCSTDSEELDRYIRREFERVYREFCRTGVRDEEAEPLPGIFASDSHALAADAAPRRVATGLAPTAVTRTGLEPRPEGAPRALAAALAREKSSGSPEPIGVLLGPVLRGDGA